MSKESEEIEELILREVALLKAYLEIRRVAWFQEQKLPAPATKTGPMNTKYRRIAGIALSRTFEEMAKRL